MSYTQSLERLIDHFKSEPRSLESDYLNRELLLHLALTTSENKNKPEEAALRYYDKTTALSGNIAQQFGTVFCNTLVRWFNHANPHQSLIAGMEKWDLEPAAKRRYFDQCQILLMSAMVTTAMVDFVNAYGNYDAVAEERLAIIGGVVRRGFWNSGEPQEDQLRSLVRGTNSFCGKVATDFEYLKILSSALSQFVENGEESKGFYLLMEEAMRRALPLTMLVAPSF